MKKAVLLLGLVALVLGPRRIAHMGRRANGFADAVGFHVTRLLDREKELVAARELLGVPEGADRAAVDVAYKRAAWLSHPDRHPGDAGAEVRFRSAKAAHDILTHPFTLMPRAV